MVNGKDGATSGSGRDGGKHLFFNRVGGDGAWAAPQRANHGASGYGSRQTECNDSKRYALHVADSDSITAHSFLGTSRFLGADHRPRRTAIVYRSVLRTFAASRLTSSRVTASILSGVRKVSSYPTP